MNASFSPISPQSCLRAVGRARDEIVASRCPVTNTRGGTRTLTPLRALDFEGNVECLVGCAFVASSCCNSLEDKRIGQLTLRPKRRCIGLAVAQFSPVSPRLARWLAPNDSVDAYPVRIGRDTFAQLKAYLGTAPRTTRPNAWRPNSTRSPSNPTRPFASGCSRYGPCSTVVAVPPMSRSPRYRA